MNANARLVLTTLVLVIVLVVSCAPSPTPEPREIGEVAEEPAGEIAQVAATEPPAVEPAATPAPTISPSDEIAHADTSVLPSRPNRLIVKNAELKLLVGETDVAIDLTTQVAADCAGYIISSRVWYDEWYGTSYKYATITIGVPVDQFERAMRRLRGLALRVVDETASGQDVTDEYVDLQSRLGNLEATRDRIREFLNQAKDIEESLRVNDQLTAIEEQIEQVRGRMNYLFDRAAYSTITVQISPELPPVTPTPTPPPPPTPTPTPPWTPMQTAHQAGHTLGSILRVLTEITIWIGIVVVPLLAPPVLLVWAVYRWVKRKETQKES
jgi:hypothetical protein